MTARSALMAMTNFGDLAVLLPIAAVIFIWLYYLPARREAAWWALAAALCMGGTALLKVFFFICPPVAELHSPSGHTSLSTLVYGGLVMLVAAAIGPWRYGVIGAGSIFVLMIATSRVALHDHSALETGTGLVIGVVALAVFARSYLASEQAQASLRPLLLSVALLLVFLHGRQLHAEGMLRAFGTYLQETSGICKTGPNVPG